MLWLYLALAGTFIFAAQELLMRVLSVRTANPRLFSVVFNLWGAAFAIIVFIFQRESLTSLRGLTMQQYLLIVAAIILYGIYERFQFFARRDMDAATFAIILRLQTVIGFVGAIVFLQEPLTSIKATGVMLIIIASMLLVYKNPKFTYSPAFWYAIVCSIALGLTGVVDKPASRPLPAALYSFILWTIPLIIVAFPGVKMKDVHKEFTVGGWKVAIAAFCNVVGYLMYLHALALAEASRVNPIVATNSVLTVLGGIILLKERDHLWRKIAAGVIAFAGVILLTHVAV